MIVKKTLILLMAVLIMLFSLLNAVPPAQDQEIEDGQDVEELIDKADYCYGILEDYPRALKYLNRAVELAADTYLKAEAIIKTAYVYFLMGKDTSVYSDYIKAALKLNNSLELDKMLYRERFIRIFNAIKHEPQATAAEIKNRLIQVEEKKNNGGKKFFVIWDTGYMFSNDIDYKKIYGRGAIFPRVKAGFKIAGNFYMCASYAAVKDKGIIPETGSNAENAQNFLALGFRYKRDFPGKWGYKLESSIVKVSYSEKALGAELEGSILGFVIEAGLIYNLGKRFFAELYTGYLSASKFILNKKVTFGGFDIGMGLGMKF